METLIFLALYLLKMCPVFVGSVHNFWLSLMMKLFREKLLISNRCIMGLLPNLIKKSWTNSNSDFLNTTETAQAAVKSIWLPSVGTLQLSESSILKRRESRKRRKRMASKGPTSMASAASNGGTKLHKSAKKLIEKLVKLTVHTSA